MDIYIYLDICIYIFVSIELPVTINILYKMIKILPEKILNATYLY